MQKIFLRFTTIVFLIAGAILLLAPSEIFPEFYNPGFMGTASLASAFLIYLPSVVFRGKNGDMLAIKSLRTAVALSLFLNGVGSLGMYQSYRVGLQYDKILHFLVSAILMAAFARFFYFQYSGMGIGRSMGISAALIFGGGIAWEVFELAVDSALGTEMLGFYGKEIFRDTAVDIVNDIMGITAGAFLFKFWYNKKKPALQVNQRHF